LFFCFFCCGQFLSECVSRASQNTVNAFIVPFGLNFLLN
jgi:hypothetical protein